MNARITVEVAGALVVLGIAAFLGSGCGSSGSLAEPQNGTLGYQPGLPNFSLTAIARTIDGSPGVDVHVGVPPASLIFANRAGTYRAAYDLLIRVLDGEGKLVREAVDTHHLSFREVDSTLSFQPTYHLQRIALGPGSYELQVIIVDAASGNQARRSTLLAVPAVDEPFLGIPVLSMLGTEGAREPLLSAFVPEQAESPHVQVHAQVPATADATLRATLLKVARDTLLPNPPYWVTPGRGSLAFRGVASEHVDSVWSDEVPARAADRDLSLSLPEVTRGLYRLDLVLDAPAQHGEALVRHHYFVVTSTNFPRVETLDQMVDALGYIAYESEVRRIREAPNPREQKKQFDAFWGSLVRRRAVAVNLLETYYARIEEANLLYSSFKEGWKTDRGMIYVLLGAPALVDTYADSEVWRYSYGDDALYRFVFDRVPIPGTAGVYENYILRRRPYYEHVWLQLLDRWRSGVVL